MLLYCTAIMTKQVLLTCNNCAITLFLEMKSERQRLLHFELSAHESTLSTEESHFKISNTITNI